MPTSAAFTVASVGNLDVQSNLRCTSFADASGTPGDSTSNTIRGRNAFAIGASAVTVTNSLVTASSTVLATLEFTDATLTWILTVIPGSGSFVVTGNTTATAATKFSWVVIN